MGLASSFYNDRNEDIAEALVKTLLETRQPVPDFLEAYLPEGFTMDGQTGDLATLKFDADSDDEEEDGENAEGDAAAGGAWGADEATPAAGGDAWGASAGDGWGASTAADSGGDTWGAPAAGGDGEWP